MQIQNVFSAGILGDCLALIAGAILTLAFAPFGIYPLAILAPALLLALWLKISKKRAFLRGWLFGIGLFTSGVYWVFISIHNFGNASIPLSVIITGGLIAILALFPAANGYFLNRYFQQTTRAKVLYAFPATWVLLEWIRSWIFSGFPWLFLGYSQINSPLKGFAPIFSVYGISLAVILSSALFLNSLRCFRRAKYQEFYFSLLALAFIWAVGSVLSFIPWTKPDGPLVKISLIQGNIPQAVKWSPDQVLPTLDRYKKLTEKHWDSKIIIWPESAVPLTLQNAESFINDMSEQAYKHHTAIITGIPVESPEPGSYYNAVVTLGSGTGIYAKQRLVPFGEFTPLPSLFKNFFTLLDIPMSDFIPAKEKLKPLEIGHLKIATFICYEIAFPEQVLSRDGEIGMILTVSNDAWFGHSIAQAQHLEIGQMRALEMGRPVLFVSNNGITAFIDPTGKIHSIAPAFETYVLTDTIQAYIGKTPWQYFGMDPILVILLFMLFSAFRYRYK
jgi:apolipoprotein N-acyltransferase